MGELVPDTLDLDLWNGVFSASLLAVFAFIGFEDMVNVAEETKSPRRTLPRAIFITLAVTTLLYVLVASVAVLSIDPAVLVEDEAPVALVYRQTAGFSSDLISTIAVLAVIVLALAFPLNRLADLTSQIVLVIWALANLALILMKRRGDAAPEGTYTVPMWVPVVGLITAIGLLAITSWP